MLSITCRQLLTTIGRPTEPIFQACGVLCVCGPVHSDCPNTSMMWMFRDAKYSKIWPITRRTKGVGCWRLANQNTEAGGCFLNLASQETSTILMCQRRKVLQNLASHKTDKRRSLLAFGQSCDSRFNGQSRDALPEELHDVDVQRRKLLQGLDNKSVASPGKSVASPGI